MFDQILKNAHEKFYNEDTSIDFFFHWLNFDISLVLPVLSKSTLTVLVSWVKIEHCI